MSTARLRAASEAPSAAGRSSVRSPARPPPPKIVLAPEPAEAAESEALRPPTIRQRMERAFRGPPEEGDGPAAERPEEREAAQTPAPAPAAAEEAAMPAAPARPEVEPAPSEELADRRDEAEAAQEARKGAEAPEAAEEEGGERAAAGGGAEEKAPASPREDPAFQRVLRRVRAVARQQAHNNPARRKAAEAQAAAEGPANEVAAQAAGRQVAKMAAQEPKPFDRQAFKAALLAKVRAIAPQSVEDVDAFKSSGRTAQLKSGLVSQVDASKESSQGPIKSATEGTPDTAGTEPKPVTPQPPTVPGAPPPPVGAAAAAPKPRTEAEVSLDSSVEEVERKWSENDLTEERLRKGQEPEFDAAIASKEEVVENARTAPEGFREREAGVLGAARDEATATSDRKTGGMYDTRSEQFGRIAGEQDATRTADEQKRAEVASRIETFYENTKNKVETRLTRMDEEVGTAFDTGADTARRNFDHNVEAKKEAWRSAHPILSVAERLGWPVNLQRLYEQARDDYVREMDGVIDRVAGLVETGLTEAKQAIDDGRREVETFVQSLPQDLRQVGEDAASKIQEKFDGLESQVKEHEGQLIDSLAQKYVDRLNEINQAIEKMKQEDRGWVGRAVDQAQGVIEIYERIRALLARFGEIVDRILDDPGAFLNNLIAGIKAGLSQFIANILTHLKKGLMAWLFGAIAAAGIEIPESFDLKSIIKLALQVLGLTYANFRARAARVVGEPIVQAMETTVEIFRVVLVEGVGGLWRWIKDKVGDLKSMVLDGIIGWVKEKIVVAGITWVLGLLNPVGGLIKIANAIIKIVDFFITRGAQIMALAEAILGALSAIVGGAVGAMAGAIENALARAIPVTLGFLASLAGIGGVSEMIREQIGKVQAPVNKAIDWVIGQAVKLAKKIGGIFGKKKKEDKTPETDDPEHDAKVQAGLAAIDREEQKYLEGGKIEREDAEKVAAGVKAKHPVFKSITVVDGKSRWNYRYVASRGEKAGEVKAEGDDRPENWQEAEKVRGKPVGVTLPSGYVYFERDGIKYIRRVQADDKKFQQLGVSDDGKIIFGKGRSPRLSKSGALARAVGGGNIGYQFHHLIPDAVVRSHPLPAEARVRGVPPYNLDSASNGIRLPANEETKKQHPNLPMHKGSHRKWNVFAASLLTARTNVLKRVHGSLDGTPGEELTKACHTVEGQLRGAIQTWPTLK